MLIIKIGGDIANDISEEFLSDLAEIAKIEKVIIVHGGGDMVTEIAKKMGKEQTFVVSPNGIKSRYTDEDDIRIYTMVMCGITNKSIVSTMIRNGINAFGFSGIDASFIKALRKKKIIIVDERKRKRIIDGGFTGKITSINPELIKKITEIGLIPIISPLAIGDEYELLNVDADMVATKIASSMIPCTLIFLTDVEGVMKHDKLIKTLTLDEARHLMKDVGFGMNRKIMASIEAIESGVNEVIISSGFLEHPVSRALSHEVGTLICQ